MIEEVRKRGPKAYNGKEEKRLVNHEKFVNIWKA